MNRPGVAGCGGHPGIARAAGDAAFALALLGLPSMHPALLRAMLRAAPANRRFLEVRRGTLDRSLLGRRPAASGALLASWRRVALGLSPGDLLESVRRSGVSVALRGDHGFPSRLDGAPVAVLLGRRAPSDRLLPDLEVPTVALVGTARPTRYGEGVAATLAAGLAASGVRVVVGLEGGIGSAAIAGALGARCTSPLAVAAGGVGSAAGRRAVARGAPVLSAVAPGVAAARSLLALRDRILVECADVLVVVEARRSPAELRAADLALERQVAVAAVPGSVTSAASTGANELLAEGAALVRDVDDVLALLALERGGAPRAAVPCPVGEPEPIC